MFKFLRSQAKIFYWVIAATFILFLFLGGLTGRGCQPPGQRQLAAGIIGTVNEQPLSAQYYDQSVRQQTAALRQQTGSQELTANQYALARDRAWQDMVRQALMDEAVADLGITVTDDEVLDTFRNNPPPELLAAYRDEQGQVDIQRYFADLQNPDADWSRAELYVREILLPRRKLLDHITADVVVDDEVVRTEFIRQTGSAVAEFMGAVFADLPPAAEPTREQIEAWYRDHPEDYEQPEMGRAKVVRFAKEASDADWAEVREYLAEVREDIVSDRIGFAAAAFQYSEDGATRQDGNLGVFGRDRMPPAFTEVAFNLTVGQISEPVRTSYGYHLIEVLAQDRVADTDSIYQIEARHILLKVTPGPETQDLLRTAAEDFRSRVDAGNFVTTAQAEALDLVEPEPFMAGRDITTLRQTVAGTNWVLATDPGTVSPVFENDQFLYVVLAEEPLPAGLVPLADVEPQVLLAARRELNRTAALALLEPAVGEVQMGTSMVDAAANHGLKHAITDTFTYSGNVPDVGYATEFNEKVFATEVGQLVPQIETLRGVFAAIPRWISPVDEALFQAQREDLRAMLLGRRQAERFEEWLNENEEAAEIVDLRYRGRPAS